VKRLATDRGQVGGVEALAFGVLVFVVATLLIANAWAVVDAKFAAVSAAQEATRAYVETARGSDGEGAARVAVAAARDAVAGLGRDATRLRLSITPAGDVTRCTLMTAEAAYDVPAVTLPWIGGFGHALTVRSRHSETIDPFRNGVAGEARCA
jgi:hypothetical protein